MQVKYLLYGGCFAGKLHLVSASTVSFFLLMKAPASEKVSQERQSCVDHWGAKFGFSSPVSQESWAPATFEYVRAAIHQCIFGDNNDETQVGSVWGDNTSGISQ